LSLWIEYSLHRKDFKQSVVVFLEGSELIKGGTLTIINSFIALWVIYLQMNSQNYVKKSINN